MLLIWTSISLSSSSLTYRTRTEFSSISLLVLSIIFLRSITFYFRLLAISAHGIKLWPLCSSYMHLMQTESEQVLQKYSIILRLCLGHGILSKFPIIIGTASSLSMKLINFWFYLHSCIFFSVIFWLQMTQFFSLDSIKPAMHWLQRVWPQEPKTKGIL